MFGRRANRRRAESGLARLKVPTLGGAWVRRLRAALVLPLIGVGLYGAFKGVQLVLDQPVRELVVLKPRRSAVQHGELRQRLL